MRHKPTIEDSSSLKGVLIHARIWLSLENALLTERSKPQNIGYAQSAHTAHLGVPVGVGLEVSDSRSKVLRARDWGNCCRADV